MVFQNESIHLFLGNVETECANCIIKKLYNNNELDQLEIYWNIKNIEHVVSNYAN